MVFHNVTINRYGLVLEVIIVKLLQISNKEQLEKHQAGIKIKFAPKSNENILGIQKGDQVNLLLD